MRAVARAAYGAHLALFLSAALMRWPRILPAHCACSSRLHCYSGQSLAAVPHEWSLRCRSSGSQASSDDGSRQGRSWMKSSW